MYKGDSMSAELGTENLYTAAQTRALDHTAIHECGIPGITLMSRAAAASFELLQGLWPGVGQLQLLCGTGNNGGDGYLIADLALKRGLEVQLYQLGETDKIGGEAKLARDQALANGVIEQAYSEGCLHGQGVVVDAMLGTGLQGDVRGSYELAIREINGLDAPVLAVDIPSGLCSDTGKILGQAVVADATISFIGLNRGLFTLEGPDCVGAVQFTDLGVPAQAYASVSPGCQRLELEHLLARLPARRGAAHKGSFGSVLLIGGDHGMGGAIAMAGEAALRSGAGLVRVATQPEHIPALMARTPEIMAAAVRSGQELAPLLESATLLVVGPGLGRSPWSEQLLQVAAASGKPMVLDADGLNLLVRGGLVSESCRENWILTPHPGEAGRLLGVSTHEIQADRFTAAARLQQRYGGVVVLKGNGTIVASRDQLLLSDYGNPGMASGGMGDVLSGITGALAGQGIGAAEAAALAVCLHGAAADAAAENGQRGLLATDLFAPLRSMLG
jgi:ADP-dependent NAD(P)H-hydrate dehydratase / NAD(P)H-hydrate epimerase